MENYKIQIIEIDSIKFNEKKNLFLKLTKSGEQLYPFISFQILLKYDVQELDVNGNPHGSTYKDSFKIEKRVDVKFSDFFKPNIKVNLTNFE